MISCQSKFFDQKLIIENSKDYWIFYENRGSVVNFRSSKFVENPSETNQTFFFFFFHF